MRVQALHEDVLVATSAVWQTTCTLIRGGDEGFVVDSPLLPNELEALPALLARAQFPFSGLLATHGDWDHVLGRLAFPSAALGVAETTAARLTGAPGEAARKLRDFDREWYVPRRALSLGQVQALPVPGRLDVGPNEIECHPADGHTVDGMFLWLGWARVLICGDYLSPVEKAIFVEDAGGYAATLRRLRPFAEQAIHVVPGHGRPLTGAEAIEILEADLRHVEDGVEAPERRA